MAEHTGLQIKLARVRRGLTQAELAGLVGVSQGRMSQIERQEAVSLDMVEKISDALGAVFAVGQGERVSTR